MSFEVFEKLEAKVQQAIDTIILLQMEIDELKKNQGLFQKGQEDTNTIEILQRENEKLKKEQSVWKEHLEKILGKMDEV